MPFTRISNAQLNSRGATTLPNQPQISAAALKQEFDAPAKNIVAPAVNNLMDELEASTSANSLGAVAPTGRTGTTVQGVLNSISSDLGNAEAQSHAHPNKAIIDKFDDTGTGLTYDGNPVGAVTSVNGQTGAVSLTASDVGALPSSTTIPTKTSDLTNDSNFVADASYVHTDNNYDATAKAIVDGATAAINAKSTVSWNQIDTTGTKIAEITIDGVKTDVKATGGGSADAYKTITSGGQSFVASGADEFKINAGSNVTITPLQNDKGIQISATGGGQSTGDMLMSAYDSQANVKSAGGIDAYVTGEIGKLDVSDSAVSGQYVSAVSEADGKISVTRASLPTVPTKVSDLTNDSGYQTSSDVATAISGKEDKSALKDLAYIAKDGVGSTKVLQGDGTWVTPSSGGHTMIPNNTAITSITAKATDSTDDDVASGYAIANWSNAEITTLIAHIDSGDDTVGVWNDAWETDGIRTGWVWHECLYHTIPDNEVEISIDFAIGGKEVVGLYAYRVDDEVAHNGVNGGAIAIKLTSPIQNASGVDVAINLKRQRTNLVTNPTILS